MDLEQVNQKEDNQRINIEFGNLKYVKTKIEAICYLVWRAAKHQFNLNISVEEINPDYYKIKIQDIVLLKVIQISHYIKIFCAKTPSNSIIEINLNIYSFFKKYLSNQITLDDTKINQQFLNLDIYSRLLNIFDSRIYLMLNSEQINQNLLLNQRHFIICMRVNTILLRVCKFLNKKDLLNFLTLNYQSNKNYANNKEFWYQLYSSKYGKSGFKLNQLEWKKVYLQKIK
ncbi:hypothetical protein TTHERM_00046300 (macronuclear) [Tetrahymena thermophila SB210]|uniref:Uncharacterized protein n=1 Tax=Tetrahymena thermophila (strain SB210) TaxID=312017 RepID=Q23DR1_TETTS|nr:hypothetical protein TTHERM_00046300 [Tetrahymena thermophila SB210]EAR94351.2 hypothetical protein TTHERM_00046300 [Tetrahymena thermophila SB210]|eukprot:XP_001014625.2 hypothetical protein TTHERM_00046300 [Tetrahymena thermophila SB210]